MRNASLPRSGVAKRYMTKEAQRDAQPAGGAAREAGSWQPVTHRVTQGGHRWFRYHRPGQDAPLRERINMRIRDTLNPYARRTKRRRTRQRR